MTRTPTDFGVSFSLKQCRGFGLNPKETLGWLINEAGFRRFRLMSYWNEHEKEQGKYNFSELDWQIAMIRKSGGEISLCLGVKQPRWPEYHWPKWTEGLTEKERSERLLAYIDTVVTRYKDETSITSWQLENEALLQNFGVSIHIDRKRLRKEFNLIKRLDPTRPILMSTSNGWGIPLRRPIPDKVGFSYYPIMYKNGAYHKTVQKPWLHRWRKRLIYIVWRRSSFIHELQLEPWGPTAIWKMSIEEQNKSINMKQIKNNITQAKAINAYPIDLWGGEWWYWRLKKGNDSSIWDAVKKSL